VEKLIKNGHADEPPLYYVTIEETSSNVLILQQDMVGVTA